MSNQTTNTAQPEGVTIDEFIVHTKHTCDSCYIRPIVGKRYTSNSMKDFDLCSTCFGACDEEKKGEFSETLLARDKAVKNTFILKLKIENGGDEAQTRRINVSHLWDPSVSQLSFDKLLEWAGKFAQAGIDGKEDAKLFDPSKAQVTYIDEDGDKIHMNSNAELMDSFIQTVKKQPFRPFRITVTTADAKANAPTVISVQNKPNVAPIAMHAQVRHGGRCGRRNLALKKLNGMDKMDNWDTAVAPRYHITVKGAIEEEMKRNPAFIHARHTCDLCNRTPIIGVRYHATKVPNFDICHGCHEKYEGEDLGFVPETFIRDIQMQGKWLKKHLMTLPSQKELATLLESSRRVVAGEKKTKPSKPTKEEDDKAEDVASQEHDLHLKEADVSTESQEEKLVDHKSHGEKTEANESTSEADAPAPAAFFIHARHTCDGCSKTPIIGTRYRATKIPDFDLCEACFKSYEGDDLDFKPETLDIDCRMQPRWLRKLRKQVSRSGKSAVAVGLMSLFEHEQQQAKMTTGAGHSAASSTKKGEDDPQVTMADLNAMKSYLSHFQQQAKLATAAAHFVAGSRKREDRKAEDKSVDAKDIEIDTEDKKETQPQNNSDADAASTQAEDNENAQSKTTHSPKGKEHDESFLSDAEGHGSIAEVIGRTLDVCVQAMEEVLDNEMEQIKHIDEKDVAAIASAVADTYSVGSSMISSVTDILKKVDDSQCSKGTLVSDMTADAGATILKSVDDSHTANGGDDVHSDHGSVGSDDWSVIGDKKDKNEFAGAAEVIGSFLYNSDIMSTAEKGESKEEDSV